MTIPFTCPYCGTQTDAYEEYAGRSGPCVVCGKTITVPYPTTVTTSPNRPTPAPLTPAVRGRSPTTSVSIVLAAILGGLLAVFCLIVVLFMVVFPAVSAARNTARKTQSAKNLERIAMALRDYEVQYGCFPPAYVADAKGKPMHSWRVLLLPHLGYRHVYQQYDFGQPWDSPRNMMLAHLMPTEYACPADPDARTQFETSYLVVVGDRTLFPGARCVKAQDIKDGDSDTLLVVETPTCGISWLAPKDLDFRQMRFEINGKTGVEIGSQHRGGAHVVTADGKSHFLRDGISPEVVQAMATIQGGESIPWSAIEP
jgi:hypothetical protein